MTRDPSLPIDATTAREIAIRDGYPIVVAGELEGVGEGYLLTARIEAASDGEVLGRFRTSVATADDLVTALESVGREIRARIGESLRAIRRDPPLQQVTTSSLEALRLYTEAMRASHLEAIPLLERAVALDTAFAAAYGQLEFSLSQLLTEPDRQAELTRKAYAHRDRLTEYQRLVIEGHHVFGRVIGGLDPAAPQPDECDVYEPVLHLYEAYVRRHPEDPRPLQNYAFYQEFTGHREQAMRTLRRLVAMEPSNAGSPHNLFVVQLRMGLFDEARETLAQWAERLRGSDPWRLRLAEIELYARQGEYAAADSAATLYEASVGSDPDLLGTKGDLDAVRGRMGEALRHYEAAIRWTEQAGHPDDRRAADREPCPGSDGGLR